MNISHKMAAFVFIGAYAVIGAGVRYEGLHTNEGDVKKTLTGKNIEILSISSPSELTGCREYVGSDQHIGYACSDGKIIVKTAKKSM